MRYRLKHRLPYLRFDHLNEMPPSLVQVAQLPACFDFPRRRLPDHFHYIEAAFAGRLTRSNAEHGAKPTAA